MKRIWAVAVAAALASVPALAMGLLPTWSVPQAHAGQGTGRIVQIVAHEDDDLLFMNPDLLNGIRAGIPVETVYLTAGDANRGEAYARDRQAGIRLAYAHMAGAQGCGEDGNGCWTKDEYRPVAGGPVAERFRLNGGDAVQVVFLNLPEEADSGHLGGDALRKLWNDPALSTETLDMDGPGEVWPQRYDRDALISFLSGLLGDDLATLVRMQDPAPDPLLYPQLPQHDHPDHISAAWFADAAVAQYGARNHRRVVSEHHRDYNIANSPANLSSDQAVGKHITFEGAYVPKDSQLAAVPGTAECAVSGQYKCWQSRQYPRVPRSTQAVARDRAGALHAFVVEGGLLYEWAEDGRKVWRGPNTLGSPDGPLTAGLSVGQDRDGLLRVFTQRADTGEIFLCSQRPDGGWDWSSLGSPNTISAGSSLTNDALQVSTPVVAANADGRLQLFVRNRGGGVSTAQQSADGGWGGWADLGESGIQGAPTAVTGRDGRIELFAVAVAPDRTTAVRHWAQPAPNAPLAFDPGFPLISPSSGITVGTAADGRLELFYRQLDTPDPLRQTTDSYTMNLRQGSPGGGWVAGSSPIGAGADQGGTGEAAVATAGPVAGQRMVLAVRNRSGGVSVSSQGRGGAFGGWTDLGAFVVGVPAAGVDRDGLVDLVTIGVDGRLYDNRQSAGGRFGGWQPMGGS
ncbi:hypothetical protein [Kitasatospora sp. NPDC050543]|uniref:hypothetical protein n=1 Tax=Kitasatospora sp. NPDC050543 TaxID=3364054 RepID=UPI0037900743